MPRRIAERLASRYLHNKRVKTAGEVRFIKDNSGDQSAWAFTQGPSEREIYSKFEYESSQRKPLAEALLSATAAMAHAFQAYQVFNNVRSADVSPDGRLGGRGYVQNIKDMRRQFTNIVEALSSLSDTIYDEIQGAHWAQLSRQEGEEGEEEKKEDNVVEGIVSRVEEIREDPKKWVREDLRRMSEEEEEVSRPKKRIKKRPKIDPEAEKKEAEKKEAEKKEAEKKEAEKKEAEKKEAEKKAAEKKEAEKKEAEKKEAEKKEAEGKAKKKPSPAKATKRDKELKKQNKTPYRRR